jgi:DHA2 family multidrug resistance protein
MSGAATADASGGAQGGAPGGDAASDAAWRPKSNPWLIAVVVTLAAFMEILDTTIVNVSLPHIAGSVAASYDDATWTLTSYLVANGIVLPVSGFIGRLIGRKRYFLICIAMFTVCSFLCGTATSLAELVMFRLLQGFFGGGLQPNQQSIILDTFEPAKRGAAFGVVSIAVIFAPAIGPTLGGWITDNYSWRWIFWINIPVGLLAFFAVNALVEDPPWVKRQKARIGDTDWIGLGLIALGLGCLQVMMDRGEDEDWFGSGFIRLMAIFAAIGISGAIVWLSTTEKPIVNLRAYLDRNFAVGSVMIFGLGAVLYSGAVLLPQLAQEHLGYTATLAGLLLSPGALVIVVLIPFVTRFLMPRMQTRYIIAFGFFIIGCAYSYSHFLTPDVDFATLAYMRILQVLGLAFLFVPNSTITYSTLPKELNGDGSALYVMIRNVAGSIGISLASAAVTQRAQVRRAYLAENLTPFNQAYQQLLQTNTRVLHQLGHDGVAVAQTARGLVNQTLNQQAYILAYTDVFAYCAIAAFCVVPLAFLFRGSVARGGGGGGGGH